MKHLTIIISAIFSLTIVIAIGFIGLLLSYELITPFNVIALTISILIGLFLGNFNYQMMTRRGILQVITGNSASFELDDLKPNQLSDIHELDPNEMTNNPILDKIITNRYKIAIWGDNNGRKLSDLHEIKTINYDNKLKTLEFQIRNKCVIKVKNPKTIHITKSYIKIKYAKEIVWQLNTENKETEQFVYLNTGKEIETKSNTKWKPHRFDLGIGMHALYLQC